MNGMQQIVPLYTPPASKKWGQAETPARPTDAVLPDFRYQSGHFITRNGGFHRSGISISAVGPNGKGDSVTSAFHRDRNVRHRNRMNIRIISIVAADVLPAGGLADPGGLRLSILIDHFQQIMFNRAENALVRAADRPGDLQLEAGQLLRFGQRAAVGKGTGNLGAVFRLLQSGADTPFSSVMPPSRFPSRASNSSSGT